MPLGVPMTLQTLAIPFAGIVLGAKKGAIATFFYVLLGAIGVPVFAGFSGGFGIVLGPTGGFILSFPIMALIAGIGAEKNNKLWLWSGLIVGTIIKFLCGMVYFSFVTGGDLKTSFFACVLPFIPTGIIKIAITAILGVKLRTALLKFY